VNGLAGKIAVVTGAASGIGRATAERLSKEGASVVAVDWNGEGVEVVVEALPGPAVAVSADVSREEDIERYMQVALDSFGRVELVHLNAGISGTFKPFREVETDEFDRVIEVNLRSVFLGLRAALRRMAEQGGGARSSPRPRWPVFTEVGRSSRTSPPSTASSGSPRPPRSTARGSGCGSTRSPPASSSPG
jgi:NAD(P)-dependent dehydrogenase (short-subunit alcohol dehydrogenase family)